MIFILFSAVRNWHAFISYIDQVVFEPNALTLSDAWYGRLYFPLWIVFALLIDYIMLGKTRYRH
jgi:hypothetical protein